MQTWHFVQVARCRSLKERASLHREDGCDKLEKRRVHSTNGRKRQSLGAFQEQERTL